ncbi:cystathionine beta-lyase (plasmid) [Ralstonia sp. 25C]|uniref:cystathionine beta-lyase n=1 Tax=Ralstonia sp. 25C TaxID=3447363 RepID=UPI003F74E879
MTRDARHAAEALATRIIHAGSPPFVNGSAPVNVPIERTSTVRHASTAAQHDVQARRKAGENVASYGRHGSQTHRALEDALLALEGGVRAFLVPSGLLAISLTFLALLSPGDHVIVTDSIYAPVRRLDAGLLQRLGIELLYVDPANGQLEAAIRPHTRLIYTESPGSLLYEIYDLAAIAHVARRHDIVLAMDNTWASGILFRPLDAGADVSVLAATKYVAGHSDVMLGAVIARTEAVAARIAAAHDVLGLTVGADDAYLALRGVRTLPVRMAQHQRNATRVAQWLQTQPGVGQVYYPALPDDPGHALWKRDFKGANGLVSFVLEGADVHAAERVADALRLFAIGASWGGYESLVTVVPRERLTDHAQWNQAGAVLRLHVGLEDADDLIADLEQALQHAPVAALHAIGG